MASFAIFNENFYLTSYPEVAEAVTAGYFSSGLDHFQRYGLQEGRVLVSLDYNESTYLAKYPDIRAAVTAGSFSSGLSHFIQFGADEGRSGDPFPNGSTSAEGEGRDENRATGTISQDLFSGRRGQDYEPLPDTTNFTFQEGGETVQNLPITIYNEDVSDGSDIILYTIDSGDVGFSQETYVFSEPSVPGTIAPELLPFGTIAGETVNVQVIPSSPIKTAIIIIKDIDSVDTPSPGSALNGSVLNGGTNEDRLNGTDGDDVLLGNSSNDYLNGGNGNDILVGEFGADILDGGTGDDDLNGGYDSDYLLGNSGNDYLDGFYGNDILNGEDGNDTLDGWNESDSLNGGSGNDSLLGWYGEDYLDGDDGDDTLKGEGDNDTLDGGLGIDSLEGGFEDDLYIVDSVTDIITENLDAGEDEVESSVSFTLGENLENLTLTGSSDITGIGNALDNRITGSYEANNSLIGADGNDTLIGSFGGADSFVFNSLTEGIDTIQSFDRSEGDKIQVSASGFGIGSTELDRFTYDGSTGALSLFDQDFIQTTQFALLFSTFDPSLDITIV